MEIEEKIANSKVGTYNVNGIKLNVVQCGQEEKQAIMFLHGFPEFWYGWKKQINFFCQESFHVVVPDQRGYNLSEKPESIKAYTLEKLAKDIAELIQSLGLKEVYLVGHDLGAGVAWELADRYSELIKKVVIISMPHPEVMSFTLKNSFVQFLKTIYIFLVQLPWLPEMIMKLTNFALLRWGMCLSARKDTFSKRDMEEYMMSWKRDGALTSMFNWYRAARYYKPYRKTKIKVPTLIIWGEKEKFLSKKMAIQSLKMCEKGQINVIKGGTHWLHHEKSEEVNKVILEFFKE